MVACTRMWKYTQNRGNMRIQDVVHAFLAGDAPQILTVNGDGQTEYGDILNALERPHTRPFVQVYVKYIKGTKSAGRSRVNSGVYTYRRSPFIVTENHRFKTARGWVEASSLVAGDIVYALSDRISYVQEQVILGTLLGDGLIYTPPHGGNFGFIFSHGVDQYDYLKLKGAVLGELCKEDEHLYPGGYEGSKGTRRFVSPVNTHISDLIRTHCVVNGKKRITAEWCQKLSPISLAIWYCDDGSTGYYEKQRPRASISTHCFSVADIEILRDYLYDKLGVVFHHEKCGSITFTADSSDILFTLISPYVPTGMQYKLPEEYRSGHCYLEDYINNNPGYKTYYPTVIERVETPGDAHRIRSGTMEYDIETENHNYFANSILVHNSNSGIYLDADGNWHMRSRNMDIASEQFHNYFKITSQFEGVIELLKDAEQWGDAYVVFGELLMKGKSPTKIEYHEDHSFVVFDIWSAKTGGFLNYTKVYQECYHHGLPVVELWGTCRVKTLESLLLFRDAMLGKSIECKREGTVGKYVNGAEFIYFKEKNDTPKYEEVPRVEDPGNMRIILPPLPDSELCGAVDKALADCGDGFFDTSKAMPLIAQYTKAEQQKHNCAPPVRKLFDAYKERVDELRR